MPGGLELLLPGGPELGLLELLVPVGPDLGLYQLGNFGLRCRLQRSPVRLFFFLLPPILANLKKEINKLNKNNRK